MIGETHVKLYIIIHYSLLLFVLGLILDTGKPQTNR